MPRAAIRQQEAQTEAEVQRKAEDGEEAGEAAHCQQVEATGSALDVAQ